ncbi:MAG TPA: serine/threonine-protein kinase [Polyangia bacterium]|nr:serine/threonine-protein kinase [Polyangia bacterium]
MENHPQPASAGAAQPQGLGPGVERYGRYYLIERIGRGGMAEVFRAVAQGVEGFRRVFVIKRLRPEKSDSNELVRMFCDEARLCALLHHPNVVQVYDFGQIRGTYFLAMEYLRGKDLSAVMKALRAARKGVSPSIAAHIAQQVATGLHYAHTLRRMDGRALSIVHRDVTPSNIMLQRTGTVKILDFGIAQATNFARQVETGGGRVKGKLAYLSPEQVRIEELDGRSDVFALGVVLWEMLTGRRLFSADNEFLTMRNVLTQPIPAPSSIRPEVPRPLDDIVARALERERGKRYPDAREMADALERYLRMAPCHSQALAHLLHDLFGEESAEHTPDLPDWKTSDTQDRANAAAAATPAPPVEVEIDIEIDAGEATSDDAALLAGVTPGPAPLAPDRRPFVRGVVAALCAATLVTCLSWALWHARRPAPAAASEQQPPPFVGRPSAVAAGPAPLPVAAAPALAAAPAPARAPHKARAPAGSPRARVARKRDGRSLSSDVTLDPFK